MTAPTEKSPEPWFRLVAAYLERRLSDAEFLTLLQAVEDSRPSLSAKPGEESSTQLRSDSTPSGKGR